MAPLGAGRLIASLRHRLDLSGTRPPRPAQRVLVHATTSLPSLVEVRARHRAIEAFDQRALLMAGRDDLVAIRGEVDAGYLEYLESLGIGPSAANIISVDAAAGLTEALLDDGGALARLARLIPAEVPVRLEPFIAGTKELELARRIGARIGRDVLLLGDPGTVERVNRKDLQRCWAQELGVPVAEGETVTLEPDAHGRPRSLEPLRRAVERRLRRGHRALVRGCDGASGSATRIVADGHDLEQAVGWAARRGETTYLIDRLYEIRASPNILAFVPPERDLPPCFVAATDQILDAGLGHAGNRFPSRAALLDEMVAHAERLGQHLRSQGYAGWVGCDFCEHVEPAGGSPRLFFAELNARINGACYPVTVAARQQASGAGAGAFVSGFVATGTCSFGAFAARLGAGLLGPAREHGVLPYNIGCLPHGYCAAVALDATPEAAQRQWNELAGGLAPGPAARGTPPG